MLEILHHVIAAEADMEIVGVVDDGDLSSAIRRTRADVMVVGQDRQAEHKGYARLLCHHPHIKVLAIADNGKSGSLYKLRPRHVPLGKISARTLVKAIRGRATLSSETRAARKKSVGIH
jgi:hypothetical protein